MIGTATSLGGHAFTFLLTGVFSVAMAQTEPVELEQVEVVTTPIVDETRVDRLADQTSLIGREQIEHALIASVVLVPLVTGEQQPKQIGVFLNRELGFRDGFLFGVSNVQKDRHHGFVGTLCVTGSLPGIQIPPEPLPGIFRGHRVLVEHDVVPFPPRPLKTVAGA